MRKNFKILHICALLVTLVSCANPTDLSFKGLIQDPNNAIVAVQFEGHWNTLLTFRTNNRSYAYPLKNTEINLIEIPAGTFEILRINDGYNNSFNPNIDPIDIEKGKINYIGKILAHFDYENSTASAGVKDEEKKAADQINLSIPNAFQKYPFTNKLANIQSIELGSISDYSNLDIPMPGRDNAILVVYRKNGFSGDAITTGIFVNDHRVVGLESNEYTWLNLPSNKYMLKAHTGIFQQFSAKRGIYLESGEAHFYFFNGSSFQRMNILKAAKEIENLDYDEATPLPEG